MGGRHDISDNSAWIPVQGTAFFALPVYLAIEARVSYIMSDIKRVKDYVGRPNRICAVIDVFWLLQVKDLMLSGRVVLALVQSYLVSYELEGFLLAQEHFNK